MSQREIRGRRIKKRRKRWFGERKDKENENGGKRMLNNAKKAPWVWELVAEIKTGGG